MTKVFIDGSHGTTGLRIYERLSDRKDIELISLTEEHRKDIKYRQEAINNSDISFFCLPDAAAIEAAKLCTDPDTVIIDTSTAHRTDDNWTYGFPEIAGLKEKIASAKLIANPGCHASGFIALVAPLVEKGILSPDSDLSCFSITGYSGGGKKMIEQYENGLLKESSPGLYGLSQEHKHLPEMKKMTGIKQAPHFMPVVAPYYSGMEVVVPIFKKDIKAGMNDICKLYSDYYKGAIVKFVQSDEQNGFAYAATLSGRDDMHISVYGNDDRILLAARFDNLGKGASGAAIQNMNIVLGIDETTGLNLGD